MITFAEAQAQFVEPATPVRAPARMATRLLHGQLFLTILISFFVVIEPAPYEFAAILLGLCCLLAHVSLDRTSVPMTALMVLWMLGGVFAVLNVLDQDKTGRYVLISLFMAFTTIIYAGLFAQDTMRRLAIMNRAYILAAMIASLLGIAGYFSAFPGAFELFTSNARATATFKDPNVFGPFLIFPLLILMQQLLVGRIRLHQLAALFIIMAGLFLSFSRGAWFHFTVSAVLTIGLMILTAPDMRARARLTLTTTMTLLGLFAIFAFALSFDAIGEMFKARAQLIQYYDAGSSMGRFNLQQLAIAAMVDNPLGLGPFEFVRLYGLQQHNVYLQAFLVYGWLGGAAYVSLLVVTLIAGFRAAFIRAPWQLVLIAALGAFVGEIAEGAIIDTDHWRHFFLLLGLIWALFAASVHHRRRGDTAAPQAA